MSDARSKEGASSEVQELRASYQFEKEKNEILLNEVVALEDALLNRELKDFEDVISEESSAFWKEQLLANREGAVLALTELKQAKASTHLPVQTKRPLHNRDRSRPSPRRGLVGEGGEESTVAAGTAVRIRNRAQELCKSERMPFSTAFRQAEKEICGEVDR